MADTDLKPCPFCGGEPLEFQVPGFSKLWRIECKNCDAGPSSSFALDDAQTIWNTRVETHVGKDGKPVLARDLEDRAEAAEKRVAELEAERYALAYAITGGEDAPGLLDSLPVAQLVEIARDNERRHHEQIDRAVILEGRVAELAEALEAVLPMAEDKWATPSEIEEIREARAALSTTKGSTDG